MTQGLRVSPSMIVAFVALVAALAGTAIALPGKGKVTKDDIKKGAVTKKAIKKGAVTSKALKKGAVGPAALAEGAVGGAALADGAVGTAALADGGVTDAKLAAPEAFHVIGASGQPAFETGGDGDCVWSDATTLFPGDLQRSGFYKDGADRVYLEGLIVQAEAGGGDGDCGDVGSLTDNTRDQTFVVLPPEYRPPVTVVRQLPGGAGAIVINGHEPFELTPPEAPMPPGGIAISSDPANPVTIGGISFRAGAPAPASKSASSDEELPPEAAEQFGL